MLPTPRNYAIYPAVVPADTPTEMIIAPAERSFMLFDGETYTLTAIPVNGDEDYYHAPHNHTVFTAVAAEGVLRFTYTFPEEQEHVILLARGEEKPMAELSVYSLREDLLALRPLRGDFHGHSYRSDGRRDPAALAGHYREQGYDFFSLTDHNRFYPGREVDDAYAGVKTGFTRVRGEEVHAIDSVVHVVHVGGRESVAARYVQDGDTFAREAAEYETRVPAEIPEAYRGRYARAMWVTDRIHEAGGLAIFPHPYWRPGKSRAFNVRDELAMLLLKSGMFDAYELVGGMEQEGVNRSIALWADLRAEGVSIPAVGSSDVHGLEKAKYFPHYFTVCFAEENTNDAIIDAVRASRSVAVEASGYEYDRQYRCYGSLRLVSYCHFLLRNYFPAVQRLCSGEGVAMRAYAMNEVPASLVEAHAEMIGNFSDRFFGKKPPVLPSAELRAYVEHCRDIQRKGPNGKGSLINSGNIQI